MADGDSLLGPSPADATYGGLLNPAQQRQVAIQQIIGILGGAGAAAQPSRLPVPLGMALGRGALEGQEAGTRAAQTAATLNALGPRIANEKIDYLNKALQYNLWAPLLGQKPIPLDMGGMPAALSSGFPAALSPPSAAAQPPAAPAISGAQEGSSGSSSAPGGIATPQTAPPLAQSSALPQLPPAFPQNTASIFASMPPPLLAKMGIPVPPELTAAYYAGYQPGSPEFQNITKNVAIKAGGVQPVIGGERPGVVPQYYDPAQGKYVADLGALGTMRAGEFAAAQGRAQGELGAKETQAAFEAGLKIKTDNENLKRKTFYDTGVMPPDYSNPQAIPDLVAPNGDRATTTGNISPAMPKQNTYLGADALAKQNTTTQKTEENFGTIRGTLEGTEARMVGLAKALQIVESRGLNEGKAEIANVLNGAGLPSDWVMSAKDVGAVQTALGLQTLDVLGQLKQINQGTGGRILNSEFINLLNKQYGPNLKPQANYDLITQALGGVYQTRNMIDSYYKYGRPDGWRDANAYQSAYYSNPQNSYENEVKRASGIVGPLKGMAPQISKEDAQAELRRRGLIQ